MRILYHSAAPQIPTGYGRVTREVIPRLKEEGHEVAVQSLSSVSKSSTFWDGRIDTPDGIDQTAEMDSPVKIYPSNSKLGLGDIEKNFNDFDADILFTHFDTWIENARNVIPQLEIPYVSYVIVDHNPAPEAVVQQVSNALQTVSMSKYAKKKLNDKGVRSRYIPHGVDTDVYKPVETPDVIETQDEFGSTKEIDVDDNFIVGMVAANHGDRKNIPAQMEAFNRFINEVDDDAYLYIHTNQNSPKGYNLKEVQREIGLPDTNIIWPRAEDYHNVGDEFLNAWYNSFDVYLNCSMGESWGLTITEAMSAGTMPIVSNFSSMPEQLGADIEYADPDAPNPINEGSSSTLIDDNLWKHPHGLGVGPTGEIWREKVSAKQYICNPDSIFKALRYAYDTPQVVEQAGEDAAQFVRDNYDWDDCVLPKFVEMFELLEN